MALLWPSTPIVLPTRRLGLLLSLPLALACNPDEVPPLPVVPPERAIYSDAGVSDGGSDCVEIIDPPHVPNCCRTPELEAEFIPTEPVCWRDGAAYDDWRLRHQAAYFETGDCKAVHEGDACVFE